MNKLTDLKRGPKTCCSRCKHWEGFQIESGGMCRRFPPQIRPGTAAAATRNYFNWFFPVTLEHDVCGEFEKK